MGNELSPLLSGLLVADADAEALAEALPVTRRTDVDGAFVEIELLEAEVGFITDGTLEDGGFEDVAGADVVGGALLVIGAAVVGAAVVVVVVVVVGVAGSGELFVGVGEVSSLVVSPRPGKRPRFSIGTNELFWITSKEKKRSGKRWQDRSRRAEFATYYYYRCQCNTNAEFGQHREWKHRNGQGSLRSQPH